jgi:tripeptide aminopeptidase
VLVNAALVAATLACALPRHEAPETTDGEMGYWCAHQIEGNTDAASLSVLIRDYEESGALRRVETVQKIAAGVEAQFPGSTIAVEWKQSYANFAEILKANPLVMSAAVDACEKLGIKPVRKKIRGGTDESTLQSDGFALANLCTGASNIHSKSERVSVATMVGVTQMLWEIIKTYAAAKRPAAG